MGRVADQDSEGGDGGDWGVFEGRAGEGQPWVSVYDLRRYGLSPSPEDTRTVDLTFALCCLGYRRGKPSSKDVDMVFTHPSSSSAVDIKALNAFVKHLETQGHLTGVLSGSTQASGNSTRALCQKYVVLKLPEKEGGEKRVHRRVDIVFARRSHPFHPSALFPKVDLTCGFSSISARRVLDGRARMDGLDLVRTRPPRSRLVQLA